MKVPDVSRGEIWSVKLDPVIGHEQAGTRPALIISVDGFNHGPSGLAVVLPITSHDKHVPFHVQIEPPESGLPRTSFVKCEDVRSVSRERLRERRGTISASKLDLVEDRLRILLGL